MVSDGFFDEVCGTEHDPVPYFHQINGFVEGGDAHDVVHLVLPRVEYRYFLPRYTDDYDGVVAMAGAEGDDEGEDGREGLLECSWTHGALVLGEAYFVHLFAGVFSFAPCLWG